VVDPGHATTRAQAAATDIRQRLRAASEALSADLRSAGSGPVNGVFGRALGTVAPSVLPFRLGPRGDPPGAARSDALSLVSAAGVGAAAALAEMFVPASGVAQLAWVPGCPVGDESCGLRAGMPVLILDGRGQSDLFNVSAVAGGTLSLESRGTTSGRPFPRGSLVVPVIVSCYYLRPGTAADGLQLMAGDGDQSDLPFVDHLAGLTIELLGDPNPPRLASGGTSARAVTYGPLPPPPGEDDLRDQWPAGENCTFAALGGLQQSRMPTLPLDAGAGLAALTIASLTDGPWCPDHAAPNRYDADLLRIRAVRVTIRAEASSAAVRGADTRLFLVQARFDYAVSVEGPLVARIHAEMRHVWRLVRWARIGHRPPPPALLPLTATVCGTTRAALLLRDNLRHRRDIEHAYLNAIHRARHTILISSAYFFPGRRLRKALLAAAKRGVSVKLLLQGRVEYVLQHYATQSLCDRLLSAGVRVFEYEKGFLHAKVAVIDRDWATVGSSNIDPFSLLMSREANVVVRDAAFAGQLRASLEAAMEGAAREIRPEDHRQRSWLARLASAAAYSLVRILIGVTRYGGKQYID